MPMYLGSSPVKGMYLGTDLYGGFALGTYSNPYDYGIKFYDDPSPAIDVDSWYITDGGGSKGVTPQGIRFIQGAGGGSWGASLYLTTVVGKSYDIYFTLHADSDDNIIASVNQNGAPDYADFLAPGDTLTYNMTSTNSNFSISLGTPSLAAGSDIIAQSVIIREVN